MLVLSERLRSLFSLGTVKDSVKTEGEHIQKRKAVFLDRDGVLSDLVDRGENCEVKGKKVRHTAPWTYAEFRLKPGIGPILEGLRGAGFLAIVATNQPDLTYGLLAREDHERIMTDLRRLPLDDIFVCPHGRNDGCACKKPKPGMLLRAAEKWNINLASSWMVGDTRSDVKAGGAAGCRTILIRGVEAAGGETGNPEFVVSNLAEAARVISKNRS